MTPTLATGNSVWPARVRGARGFTLVELMMVLVILSLAAGAVAMVLPDTKGPDALGERLAARLTLASQYAVLNGEAVGLVVTPDGYRFERFRLGQWQPIISEPPLAGAAWPADVTVLLEGEDKQDRAAPVSSMPAVRFDPTGGGTAFRLYLEKHGRRYVIAGHEDGKLEHGHDQPL